MRYKAELEAIDPSVEYLMTLYLSPELTPEEIRKAAQAGIVGTPLSRSLQAICHTSESRSLTPSQASSRIRGA